MNRVATYRWLAVIMVIALLAGCSNARRLSQGKPLRNRSTAHLIKANQETAFTYDYVGMKLAVDVEDAGKTTSFKANIRMRRDSVIWVSISPALGVEMMRMIITPDSVKYISKVPGDKHYYLGDFGVISDAAGTDLDFGTIQDILVGNAVFLDKKDDHYESRVHGQSYVLISKLHRHLKKVLDTDEKSMVADAVFVVNPLDKEYQKARRRAKPEELQLKRFWLDPLHFRTSRVELDDFYNFRHVTLEFEGFEQKDEQWYPSKGRLEVKDQVLGTKVIAFKTTRIRINKAYEFPFSIPEDYERRYAP